ncbi:MAG: fuconate dehydratase, partial [Planctomyces sp.]
ISIVDYVCVTGTTEDRVAEYSDHLHEHVSDPVIMKNGRYMPPEAPGYSVKFTDQALREFRFPRR